MDFFIRNAESLIPVEVKANDNATISIVNFLKILIQDRLSVNFQK